MFDLVFIDYVSVPEWVQSDTNGATISGCRFEFHEDLNGFASYVGYDSNQTEMVNIKANLMKVREEDTYQLDSIIVNSYVNMGSYFKCRLHNPVTMLQPSSSSFSTYIPVQG